MSEDSNKIYFETAYRTGSDVWTHVPYHEKALAMIPHLAQEALALDVGTGRGLFAFRLAEKGLRVIGVDYVRSIVDKNNKEVLDRGLGGTVAFKVGDVLDVPLVDESFDLVTDIGLLQHVSRSDWVVYMREISRVLKPGGYFLNVSLSRKTSQFMGFSPHVSGTGDFEKYGVSYYFFTDEEIGEVTATHFEILDQQTHAFGSRTDPGDEISFVFTLLRKRD